MNMLFCCEAENDLYRVVASAALHPPARFESPAEAIDNAPDGAGVLILADGYPGKTTAVPPDLFDRARAKRLRLYVEYPASLPGLESADPRKVQWERGVISSDAFAPALERLAILAIHGCRFVPLKAESPHIVMARVAGYNRAVYGLTDETHPILFERPGGDVMVATTKLSQFVTARYAPQDAWREIWRMILQWLSPAEAPPALDWAATVQPSFRPDDDLPEDAELQALQRGTQWFGKSRMLLHPSLESKTAAYGDAEREDAAPAPDDEPIGDGTRGIMEGYNAWIRPTGRQGRRIIRRGDCNCESAMALAFADKVLGDAESLKVAANLLDFWYFDSIGHAGVRADPAHPAFGLGAWGIDTWAWEKAFYGDDNARLLLGTMAAAALLDTDRWDESMLKCLLANLRTTGRLGFRSGRIDVPDLETNGWRHYFDREIVNLSPHYEGYLWAAYLWAYRHTGYRLFLDRAVSAIEMTAAAYPDGWQWTNSFSMDCARMLLPLAWLVRVADTREHRDWLRRVATDLLALQAPCGAIREELGAMDKGRHTPPRANAEYGLDETAVIHENGDPGCDLLYTVNFAFLGLHEAAAATGEQFYADAADRIAEFICRVQVRSQAHPELDGAWFRAFDFDRWEYWASSGDLGWGAWCVETGWSQAWIVSVLGLRRMKTSLWDLTAGSRIKSHLAELQTLMLPDGTP